MRLTSYITSVLTVGSMVIWQTDTIIKIQIVEGWLHKLAFFCEHCCHPFIALIPLVHDSLCKIIILQSILRFLL